MDFSSERKRYSELLPKDKEILRNLWVIKHETLKKWGRFYRFEDIRNQLVRLPIERGIFPFFISHRWETHENPDPYNNYYNALLYAPLDPFSDSSHEGDQYYWIDYSCLPQQRNSYNDKQLFQSTISGLNEIVANSKVMAIRKSGDDYFSRGWCFFEWFNAQFAGKFGRTFPNTSMYRSSPMQQIDEINLAKRQADKVICGDLSLLKDLQFTESSDRAIVTQLLTVVASQCQRKVAEACFTVIDSTLHQSGKHFPHKLTLTIDDIHKKFPYLGRFIKLWTHVLQPVEPVSDRIAMFMHPNHWESLIEISQPIAVELLRLEYATELRRNEISKIDREIREVYEFCQLHMPQARYAVVAFLCFILMGYDV